MFIDAYQREALKTAIYPRRGENLTYPALGLGGEAGEVLNKVKKVQRDHNDVVTPEMRQAIKKELGGVLWYLAATADELGLSLSEIAQSNLEQLSSRQERGTLTGSGDDR
jgi:NTP pyrophosphatase (non-canonical NTP hydrolase)